jgi:hypothetical protein
MDGDGDSEDMDRGWCVVCGKATVCSGCGGRSLRQCSIRRQSARTCARSRLAGWNVDKAKVAAGGCCCAERCARIPVAGLRNTAQVASDQRANLDGHRWALSSLFRPCSRRRPPQVHRLAASLVDNARLDNAESTNPGHLQAPAGPQF